MSQITEIGQEDHVQLQRDVQAQTRRAAWFEEAAQTYASLLWDKVGESLVLARVFATVPFGKLPASNQAFVRKLADSTGITELIGDDTLVLSLMGSRGQEPAWNDRHSSQGHVGIPLASADFIDAIPMMSRLLRQMGMGLDWIDKRDTGLVAKTLGATSGVFYVREAREETDIQGRKIIAAQDFVEKYGVKTVFGLGGGFVGTSTFMTSIIFCTEQLDKEQAEAFMPQVNRMKVSTMELVKSGKLLKN